MLRGYFDELGRPRLTAFVSIPGLNFDRPVDFMVDTGSSTAALNNDDMRGIDMRPLGPPEPVGRGYGGVLFGQRALSLVAFDELDHGTRIYQVPVLLFDDPALRTLPSVLGRDVLQHWRLVHDPTNRVLDFEIWRSDDFVPR